MKLLICHGGDRFQYLTGGFTGRISFSYYAMLKVCFIGCDTTRGGMRQHHPGIQLLSDHAIIRNYAIAVLNRI